MTGFVYSDATAASFGRAGLLARAFPAPARARSFDYLLRIRLAVDAVGVARALVQGTRADPYDVRIRSERDHVIAGCNCPIGRAMIPCKHALAVIRAMDHAQAWPPGPMPQHFEVCDVRDPTLELTPPLRSIEVV